MKMLTSLAARGMPFLLSVALTASCGPTGPYQGTYVFQGREDVPQMFIELREDGTGVWRKGNERISFNWGMKGKQIRLHLKNGGVVVGKGKNDGFEISLPGSSTLTFHPEGG